MCETLLSADPKNQGVSHVDLTAAAAVMPDGPSGRLPSHPHLHLFCTGHKKTSDVWMNV